MINKKNIKILFPFIFLTILFLDQITKIWIKIYFTHNKFSKLIVNKFLNFVYIRNSGILFGFLSAKPILYKYILYTVSTTIIVLTILLLFFQQIKKIKNLQKQKNITISLALIFGGVISNYISRLLFTCEVIDFIDICIFNYHFPTFNCADFTIITGIIIFIYYKYNKQI